MDTAWIALIGTVFGGAGLKGIEMFLTKGVDENDLATKLRDELRIDAQSLKDEIRIAEKELDQWKERYYILLQEYIEIKARYDAIEPGPGSPKGGNDEEI